MNNLNLSQKKITPRQVAIICVPYEEGSTNLGAARAPEYILNLGLEKILRDLKFVVGEVKTIQKAVGDKFLDLMLSLKNSVFNVVSSGGFTLVLGGDHSIAIGSIAGAAKATGGDLGVIWIDAHADLNTDVTSISGNVHGMSAATILGKGRREFADMLEHKIKPENILFIGLKDLDQAEIELIKNLNLQHITVDDIAESGLSLVAQKISDLSGRVGNIWVSLDMDAIDKEFAPGTAMATMGGLNYREITYILKQIGKLNNVIGMDVVEIVPEKDVENKTGELAIELIASCLGSKYDWYTKYMQENNYKINK